MGGPFGVSFKSYENEYDNICYVYSTEVERSDWLTSEEGWITCILQETA